MAQIQITHVIVPQEFTAYTVQNCVRGTHILYEEVRLTKGSQADARAEKGKPVAFPLTQT